MLTLLLSCCTTFTSAGEAGLDSCSQKTSSVYLLERVSDKPLLQSQLPLSTHVSLASNLPCKLVQALPISVDRCICTFYQTQQYHVNLKFADACHHSEYVQDTAKQAYQQVSETAVNSLLVIVALNFTHRGRHDDSLRAQTLGLAILHA